MPCHYCGDQEQQEQQQEQQEQRQLWRVRACGSAGMVAASASAPGQDVYRRNVRPMSQTGRGLAIARDVGTNVRPTVSVSRGAEVKDEGWSHQRQRAEGGDLIAEKSEASLRDEPSVSAQPALPPPTRGQVTRAPSTEWEAKRLTLGQSAVHHDQLATTRERVRQASLEAERRLGEKMAQAEREFSKRVGRSRPLYPSQWKQGDGVVRDMMEVVDAGIDLGAAERKGGVGFRGGTRSLSNSPEPNSQELAKAIQRDTVSGVGKTVRATARGDNSANVTVAYRDPADLQKPHSSSVSVGPILEAGYGVVEHPVRTGPRDVTYRDGYGLMRDEGLRDPLLYRDSYESRRERLRQGENAVDLGLDVTYETGMEDGTVEVVEYRRREEDVIVESEGGRRVSKRVTVETRDVMCQSAPVPWARYYFPHAGFHGLTAAANAPFIAHQDVIVRQRDPARELLTANGAVVKMNAGAEMNEKLNVKHGSPWGPLEEPKEIRRMLATRGSLYQALTRVTLMGELTEEEMGGKSSWWKYMSTKNGRREGSLDERGHVEVDMGAFVDWVTAIIALPGEADTVLPLVQSLLFEMANKRLRFSRESNRMLELKYEALKKAVTGHVARAKRENDQLGAKCGLLGNLAEATVPSGGSGTAGSSMASRTLQSELSKTAEQREDFYQASLALARFANSADLEFEETRLRGDEEVWRLEQERLAMLADGAKRQARIDELSRDLRKTKGELTRLRFKLGTMMNTDRERRYAMMDKDRRIGELESLLKDLMAQLDAAKAQLGDEVKKRFAGMFKKAGLGGGSGVGHGGGAAERAEIERAKFLREMEDMHSRLAELERLLRESRERAADLEAENERRKREAENLATVLGIAEKDSQIADLLARLREMEERMERLLGDRLASKWMSKSKFLNKLRHGSGEGQGGDTDGEGSSLEVNFKALKIAQLTSVAVCARVFNAGDVHAVCKRVCDRLHEGMNKGKHSGLSFYVMTAGPRPDDEEDDTLSNQYWLHYVAASSDAAPMLVGKALRPGEGVSFDALGKAVDVAAVTRHEEFLLAQEAEDGRTQTEVETAAGGAAATARLLASKRAAASVDDENPYECKVVVSEDMSRVKLWRRTATADELVNCGMVSAGARSEGQCDEVREALVSGGIACVPIVTEQGRPVAIICMDSIKRGTPLLEDEVGILMETGASLAHVFSALSIWETRQMGLLRKQGSMGLDGADDTDGADGKGKASGKNAALSSWDELAVMENDILSKLKALMSLMEGPEFRGYLFELKSLARPKAIIVMVVVCLTIVVGEDLFEDSIRRLLDRKYSDLLPSQEWNLLNNVLVLNKSDAKRRGDGRTLLEKMKSVLEIEVDDMPIFSDRDVYYGERPMVLLKRCLDYINASGENLENIAKAASILFEFIRAIMTRIEISQKKKKLEAGWPKGLVAGIKAALMMKV